MHLVPPEGLTDVFSHLTPSPALTGLLCYGAGLVSLTLWDEVVLPRLLARLTPTERAVVFVTPLTACASVPPPTLEELAAKGTHYVGRDAGLYQFITLDEDLVPLEENVCEWSDEWSAFYDADVYVFKERHAVK